MVHPSNLFRSDSERVQGFSAPVGNYFNDIDCGITALPCLTKLLRLEKFAKLPVFLIVISILGLIQGIISSYFKGTSQLWFSHYNFPNFVEEWFVYFNEIFVGLLALCISYWGNRFHRTTCLGALTIFLAISGGTLAIPELYTPFTKTEITSAITGPVLCSTTNSNVYTKDIGQKFNEVTFIYFFIFQIIFSMVIISYLTHGLSYVDDHISAKHSPALLGLVLAAFEAGKQFGIYFSWIPYLLKMFSIFSSPFWFILITLTFLSGIAMVMFPKVLPDLVMKKSVNSLVSIASGRLPYEEEEKEHGFCKVLGSLLKNKILILNILSFVLIHSALMNFGLFEKYFNQSKYHIPVAKDTTGYTAPDIVQFTTNLLKQPLIAVSLITSGMFISKIKPKAKNLVIWNIVAYILVVLIFASNLLWNCTTGIYNEHKYAITIPFCSSKCNCPSGETFQPVCVDGKTYFSPCLAGCKNFSSATSIYFDCSCGSIVTEGSCDKENCKFALAFDQVNTNILTNGLVASTIVINVLITFRSVYSKYKAAALGLELTFLGLIPFVPVKIIYHFITNMFCEIRNQKGCQYFSEYFPIVINLLTISFMLVAVFLTAILFYLLKDLNLYLTEYTKYSEEQQVAPIETINTTIGTPDDNRNIEEDSPFIKQLSARIKKRLQLRRLSRDDRIKSYIEEGELVPPLQPKRHTILSVNSIDNQTSIRHHVMVHENKQKSNKTQEEKSNNNVRNSKASADSDLSSLYRFAENIDFSDGTESEPSIKISQGKIVFQTPQATKPQKPKKPKEPLILIAPDNTQPKRPAPVPDFLIESSF